MNEFMLKLIIRLRMGLILHRAATTSSLTEELEPFIRNVYQNMDATSLKRCLDTVQLEARNCDLKFCLHCGRPVAYARGALIHADTFSSSCENSSKTAQSAPWHGFDA